MKTSPNVSSRKLEETLRRAFTSLRDWLSRPVDSTLLILFRIGFGLLALRFVITNLTRNWVEQYFVRPDFHFSFRGFSWVQPLSEPGMTLVLVAMGIGALMVLLGFVHRLGSAVFMLGLVYFILAEKTYYQPHYDLLVIVSFLLIWMPLNKRWALDAYLDRTDGESPTRLWHFWILRFQILVVYAFAAVNKTNWDWINCQPVWNHFRGLSQMPFVGSFVDNPIFILTIAHGVILFEFALVVLLLWGGRARFLGIGLAIIFHLLNKLFWGLNVFPWLAILLTLLFLPPDWPKKLGFTDETDKTEPSTNKLSSAATVCLLLFCLVQLLVPLRHYAYEGPVGWNNWGWTFSWRLRQDHKTTTQPIFTVTVDEYDRTVAVSAERHLTARQSFIMSQHPALYWQLADFLARKYRRKTVSEVSVSARTLVEFNGRDPQHLIRPDVDLTDVSATWGTPDWIVPLKTTISPDNSCLVQSRKYLGGTQ